MNHTSSARTEFWARTNDGALLAVTDLSPLGGPGKGRDRPVVVLVHGWAAHRRVWGVVADHLVRDGHRVVLYDQRGHGSSSAGSEPIAVPRLARDLATVLNSTGVEDVIVCGHSGGGFAALAHALGDSEGPRPTGMVLVATAAQGGDASEKEARMLGGPAFSKVLRVPWLGRHLLVHTLGRHADRRGLEVHRQMFSSTDPEVRSASFACAVDMDLTSGLSDLRVPTVVLTGGADRVIDPRHGEHLARALPRSRLE